jgi:four helix bundle protein
MFKSFWEQGVWKLARQSSAGIYERCGMSREYGLRDQILPAAVSIASNIAEGSERGGKDFIRFLPIARRSAPELPHKCPQGAEPKQAVPN